MLIALRDDRTLTQRILFARLDDLMTAIQNPGRNERLQFAREVLEHHALNPESVDKDLIRRYLLELNDRKAAEYRERDANLQASKTRGDADSQINTFFTLFRDRGLSSDTLILSSFSVDQALQAARAEGLLAARSMRRVAVIGPGLDFTDKADGYDFYPVQTIQPFAVIDSLLRLGLADRSQLQLTTFDLSKRINRHLDTARARARSGRPYVVQLPLATDAPWNPNLTTYWKQFGDTVGLDVTPVRVPVEAGNVQIRAVSIRPAIVASTDSYDLNVVLERTETPGIDRQYDLIIGTNLLVYYDVFEQNLALANVTRMLRPGGLFLSNTLVSPSIPMRLLDHQLVIDHDDTQGDHMYWYRRD